MGKKKPKVTVSMFHMSIHMGFIQGVVGALREIWFQGKLGWAGYQDTSAELTVDNQNLFGGSQKEGGISGSIFFLTGEETQTMPTRLATKFGRTPSTIPGHRQYASLFFTGASSPAAGIHGAGFYWAANSPQLPDVKARLNRYPGLGVNQNELQWESGTAKIPRAGTPNAGIWRYLQVASSDVVDRSSANFDDSAWAEGAMAFTGSGATHPATTSLGYPTGNTQWDAVTKIWVRQTFIGYAGGPDVTFDVLADNTLTVWVNGVLVHGPSVVTFAPIAGFVRTVTIPSAVIQSGDNIIAMVAEDLHVASYLSLYTDLTNGTFDANPAHMILDALTSPLYGAGVSTAEIDMTSFVTAADTLYSEGFGLSMKWTNETAVSSIINEILDHIDAVLYLDPTSGLLTLKLIRDDYVVGNLRVIDPSSAQMTGYQRKGLGELVNEISVTWTDPATERESATPAIIDLGLRAAQGAPISDSRNFYAIRSRALAMKAGYRELLSASAPLATAEIALDRQHWDIVPGEAFVLTWPERSITQTVMRVIDVDYGEPKRSPIRIRAIEDKFGLDLAVFDTPPSTQWVNPQKSPTPADYTQVFTLPWFFLVNEITDGDLAVTPDVAAGVLAATLNTDSSSYELLSEQADAFGVLSFVSVGIMTYLARGTLEADLVAEITTDMTPITLTSGVTPAAGSFVIIGDGDETQDEICLVTAVGTSPPNWTLQRGALDTTPKDWPIGTPFWVIDVGSLFADDTIWAAGGNAVHKLLTITSLGTLGPTLAPTVTTPMTNRPHLPTRPADVTVNGVGFGIVDATTGSPSGVNVDWATRNRLTEDAVVLPWDSGNVTEEAGQSTTVTIMRLDRTVLQTYDAVSAPYTVPSGGYAGENFIIVRVTSKIAGVESLQGHEITVIVDTNYLTLQTDALIDLQSGNILEING